MKQVRLCEVKCTRAWIEKAWKDVAALYQEARDSVLRELLSILPFREAPYGVLLFADEVHVIAVAFTGAADVIDSVSPLCEEHGCASDLVWRSVPVQTTLRSLAHHLHLRLRLLNPSITPHPTNTDTNNDDKKGATQ